MDGALSSRRWLRASTLTFPAWGEECGLDVRIGAVAGVLDRVVSDPDGRVRYHWVLVDYLAYPESAHVVAGSDAAEAQWVRVADVHRYDTTDGLIEMIDRAVVLAKGETGR